MASKKKKLGEPIPNSSRYTCISTGMGKKLAVQPTPKHPATGGAYDGPKKVVGNLKNPMWSPDAVEKVKAMFDKELSAGQKVGFSTEANGYIDTDEYKSYIGLPMSLPYLGTPNVVSIEIPMGVPDGEQGATVQTNAPDEPIRPAESRDRLDALEF